MTWRERCSTGTSLALAQDQGVTPSRTSSHYGLAKDGVRLRGQIGVNMNEIRENWPGRVPVMALIIRGLPLPGILLGSRPVSGLGHGG